MSVHSSKILKEPRGTFDRIAFYGPMAAGKSWCAGYLTPSGYRPRSLASKLKSIAYDLYEVQGKTDWERKLLQDLGSDLRKHDKDVFIKYLLHQMSDRDKTVVDDLRFINEANYFRENGFILVLVTVDEYVRQDRIDRLYPDTDSSRHHHPSEQEWQEIEPDFVVNSTTPKAETEIESIITNVTYRPSWKR